MGRPAALGDLRGLREHPDGRFGMVDGEAYDAEKAYKDSKLCNILFAHELQRRLAESGSKIEVWLCNDLVRRGRVGRMFALRLGTPSLGLFPLPYHLTC